MFQKKRRFQHFGRGTKKVKMKNLHLLKEEFIRLADSPELLDLIKTSTAYFDEDTNNDFIEKHPYAFVSYIDLAPKRLIDCTVRKENEFRQVQKLPDLLISQNPKSFHEILYIATFYQPIEDIYPTITVSPFTSCLAPPDEFLDGILAESRGYLAYNHQLEMLYRMITGCAPLTATKFRQGLFKKACSAWAEAEIIRFPNGNSLKNVMDERMPGGFTVSPNYHGAMNLYECCFS
jgi:hypothetical protein